MRPAPRTRRPADGALTPLWRALADPTRRAILDLLRQAPRTTGFLADQFPTTRFAVMKHLGVLESAGLVVVRRRGRERWNHLNAVPLQIMYERWVKPYQALWAARLTNMKSRIEGDNAMTDTSVSTIEQTEVEIEINARPERVWKALVEDTTFWWPKDFYTSPRVKAFRIEPQLGGRMYEDWGDGAGLVWFQVFGLNPPASLDLQGCMGLPFGPAHTLVHIELEARGNTTALRVSDATIGVQRDCGTGGTKADGWRQLFGALKKHVESGPRAEREE